MAKKAIYVHEYQDAYIGSKAYRQRADGGVDVGRVHKIEGEFITILWSEPGATQHGRISKRYSRGQIDRYSIIIEGR